MKVLKLRFWLALLLVAAAAGAATRKPATPLARYAYQRPEMGMAFRIVLYAAGQSTADRAAESAFQRIEQLNGIMSDYEPDSELSKLSDTSGQGRAVRVSEDLWTVLARAQALAERSDGAFDVTVGPYVKLWRLARRQHELPDPTLLTQAGRAVGYRHVRLNPKRRTVELLERNMRLDLGGIAKGYALDAALKVVQAHGIRRALVEAGGDLRLSEPPPDQPGWRVELSSVDATDAPPARLLFLKNCGISTSGDLYQRVDIGGKRYSHIIDPHTGMGLTDHSVVNVIAPDGITADSLTKVLSVLGPQKGLAFIEKITGVAARTMRESGGKIELSESSGFAQYYQQN